MSLSIMRFCFIISKLNIFYCSGHIMRHEFLDDREKTSSGWNHIHATNTQFRSPGASYFNHFDSNANYMANAHSKYSNGNSEKEITDHFDDRNRGQYSKQTEKRLTQIKSEFQILKGMIIDSSIHNPHPSRPKQMSSNLSISSSQGSRQKRSRFKIGEIVRNKNRPNASNTVSSSSLSKRNLTKKSQANNISGFQSRRDHFLENDKVSIGSRKSKSRHSKEHYSQNLINDKFMKGSKKSQLKDASCSAFMAAGALERQTLQVQLRNALEKIEALINREIQLKKRNHELEETLRNLSASSNTDRADEYEKQIKQMKDKEKDYEQSLRGEKQIHKQLIQKVGELEAEVLALQTEASLAKEEKNKQASAMMSLKLEIANMQILNKKIQMQRDIDLRQKDFEILRLKKQNQALHLSKSEAHGLSKQTENERIIMLQRELQERQKKYKQLLDQIENKNYLREEAQIIKLVESMHNAKGAEANDEIAKELNKLKEQIKKLKENKDFTQSQFGFQSKVISLEQALKKDEQKKQKHYSQLQKLQKKYQDIKKKYENLKKESQTQIQELTHINSKLKIQINQFQSMKEGFQQLIRERQVLNQRIQELQNTIKNYQQLQNQMALLRQTIKGQQQTSFKQMKEARKKAQISELQMFKIREESKIMLDMTKRKFQSETQTLKQQLKNSQEDKKSYQEELKNLRSQLLKIKTRDDINQRASTSGNDWEERQRLKQLYQEQIQALNSRFLSEHQMLVERITALTQTNQELKNYQRQYFTLEAQNNELRDLCKQKLDCSASVFHLWEIKEVEYNNINQIMKEIIPSSKEKNPIMDSNHDSQVNSSVRNSCGRQPSQLN